MDETVEKVFTNVERNTSTNSYDEADTSENRVSKICQEYENDKNSKFLVLQSQELKNGNISSDNLVTSNVFLNDVYSPGPLPSVAQETTPEPNLNVPWTKDLFRMTDGVVYSTGDRPAFSIEESTLDPVQQVNLAADSFINHSTLPQFDTNIRTIGSEVVAYPVIPMISQVGAPKPMQRRVDVSLPSNIKLPDTITVIKKAPLQPLNRSIADMLSNRDVTVSSVKPNSRKTNPIVGFKKAKSSSYGLPTVDLTKGLDNPRRLARRMNSRSHGRFTCQICDKTFPGPTALTHHMSLHRAKRAECRECSTQYPSEAKLEAHRQQYHRAQPDLAIPIVDLKQNGVWSKLQRLGIRAAIPLAQLHSRSGGGGVFAIPLVAVGAASNPAVCDIGLLGASNLLPIGPLRDINFNYSK